MYLVSDELVTVDVAHMNKIEQQNQVQLPAAYREFLEQYGTGTYCGLLIIELPNSGKLAEFAEYDLWEDNDNSPIQSKQITECIVIATTIDGDFIALHPEAAGGIWIPRHSTQIESMDLSGSSWQEIMDRKLSAQYGANYALLQQKPYFEPAYGEQKYEFLRLHVDTESVPMSDAKQTEITFPPEAERQHSDLEDDGVPVKQDHVQMQMALKQAANGLSQQIPPDLRIETEYSGHLFYRSMGGYLRFNYAYGSEVALFYNVEDHVHISDPEGVREVSIREILRELNIY